MKSLVGVHGGLGVGFGLAERGCRRSVQELNVNGFGRDGALSLGHLELNV
jgi:hypothetical protein